MVRAGIFDPLMKVKATLREGWQAKAVAPSWSSCIRVSPLGLKSDPDLPITP